jgi:hypothetical protein
MHETATEGKKRDYACIKRDQKYAKEDHNTIKLKEGLIDCLMPSKFGPTDYCQSFSEKDCI